MTDHSLSLLVRSDPDVLTRVVVLFATRGVQVRSLTFRPSADDESRLDVVVGLGDGRGVTQLMAQLWRLVDVLRIVELTAMQYQLGA